MSSAFGEVDAEGSPVEWCFKVLIIGAPAVGKTSTIRRYVEGDFSDTPYKATIGVDFAVKLWDIAGQERFGCMTHVYYKDASAAIVMFDVTRQRTFDEVIKWKDDVDAKVHLSNGEPVPSLLLGNKCDLSPRAVGDDKMEAMKREKAFIGCQAISAKTDAHLDDAMKLLIKHLMANADIPPPQSEGGFRLGEEPEQSEQKPTRQCCGPG